MITKEEMIEFEKEMETEFIAAKIRAPVHLSDNNEDQLFEVFRFFDIQKDDWVLTTWRNHYHALLHGMPIEDLRKEVMEGRSMWLFNDSPRIFTSAIVGGICPIAVGLGMALQLQKSPKRVFCFIGDMAANTGIFHESHRYVSNKNLPVVFIIEDNGKSVGSPTQIAWGKSEESPPLEQYFKDHIYYYSYSKSLYPHVGCGKWVTF
jgi:pyruvate dehydrogenase E1 component alpha subunit